MRTPAPTPPPESGGNAEAGEENNQVLMSCVWASGRLGVAACDPTNGTFLVLRDMVEAEDFSILETCISQISPSKVLIGSQQDERVFERLTALATAEEEQQLFGIEVARSTIFRLDAAKACLGKVSFANVPDELNEQERGLYIQAVLPLENEQAVRAAGALVTYMSTASTIALPRDDDGRIKLVALESLVLKNVVAVDGNAFCALQIFDQELTARMLRRTKNAEPSLFKLMNFTRSEWGSRKYRAWFQRPTCDVTILRSRHDAVEFLAQQSKTTLQGLGVCLGKANGIHQALRKFQAEEFMTLKEWRSFREALLHMYKLQSLVASYPLEVPAFGKLAAANLVPLQQLVNLMDDTINFADMGMEQRVPVKQGISDELDHLTSMRQSLEEILTDVARQELDSYEDMEECSVAFYPSIGYLLFIAKDPATGRCVRPTHPHVTFVFETAEGVYYKTPRMKALDQHVGDLHHKIFTLEFEVMHGLRQRIVGHTAKVLEALDLAAEIDCLQSLAMAARNFKLNCRPKLVSDPIIAITNGRHILQEQYVDDFRCNDTHMSPGQGMMVLMTGPNASGKSVYLKQVGLLVYMAHIGSLLPADSATIGLTDRIVTRVMTRETVALQQSTFLMDLQQMSHVLRYATPHTLVLVDEFGKGTDLADGTGLLCASLQHLLDLPGGCPRTVVATHCHELVDQRLVTEATGNLAFKTMKVVALEGNLTYCYEVVDGHNSCSFACHIATEVGFPEAVVERAEHITNCLTHGEPVYPLENEAQNTRTNHAVDLLMAADLDTVDLRQLIRDLHAQD